MTSYQAGARTGRPPVHAARAMVATPHYLSTAAGLETLRRGGSAVDAMIAGNAVLCVVYPHWSGPGGDGFWLVHDPGRGELAALNASGPAAALATREYYRERGHPDRIPERGALAALTVPGAAAGWEAAHARFGRLPWEDLFAHAIGYAREGVPVARSLEQWLTRRRRVLPEHSVGRLLPDRRPLREGERITFPELAGTLERLARLGPRQGFYEGETAERICAALGPRGSPLRPADFAGFRPEWTAPVSTTYRGHTVFEVPPNSQGFAALEILNLLEGYEVGAWVDCGADYLHHCAEAVKLAFGDRDAWLADPRFVEVPLGRLLSKAYAAERRRRIERWRALPYDLDTGIPGGPADRLPAPAGDTVYLCAVDPDGMVASMIQSLYQDFGSMEVGGDTGVILQNRGAAFSLDESRANRLEPGKRPFHTLMPAMLYRAGAPYLAFGTMGGNGQPQTHTALVTRLVDFGYDVQQAIEAPRWVVGRTLSQRIEELYLEGRIGDAVVRELLTRGQDVRVVRDWDEDMGHAQAIRLNRETGFLEGGADPRGDGFALGF